MTVADLIIRPLKSCAYNQTWEAMQAFTDGRDSNTCDEIWLIEHPAVYTLGQNGKREHILNPGAIPVINTDRGGQVTYHGPGQLMLYALIDIRRRRLGVRELVTALEQAIIAMLAEYGIAGYARADAPGVYIAGAKVGALGLRIRRGCSYHGLALNVAMDLAPFSGINPCGYADMVITQVSAVGGPADLQQVAASVVGHLVKTLGYTRPLEKDA
jgi:lipoyl(octanoyl) transferase